MAKKFPPPSSSNDDSDGEGDARHVPDPADEGGGRSAPELRAPPNHGGAIPRAIPRRSGTAAAQMVPNLDFETARMQAIQQRRRLDSLNLDSPASPGRGGDGFGFNFFQQHPQQHHHHRPSETVSEGQELYLHFFHERLRHEGLDDVAAQEEIGLAHYHDPDAHMVDQEDGACSLARRRQSMNLENFQNPIWRQAGRDLKALADRFAMSHERDVVRRRAEQVDVRTLNAEKFMIMLKELFHNGQITRERILVLFFFCSDVAISALRCKIDGMLSQLTSWTLLFIRDQVCDWVQRNGGWQTVFCSVSNIVQQIAFVGMCAAVITACCFYVRKNFNR